MRETERDTERDTERERETETETKTLHYLIGLWVHTLALRWGYQSGYTLV